MTIERKNIDLTAKALICLKFEIRNSKIDETGFRKFVSFVK